MLKSISDVSMSKLYKEEPYTKSSEFGYTIFIIDEK